MDIKTIRVKKQKIIQVKTFVYDYTDDTAQIDNAINAFSVEHVPFSIVFDHFGKKLVYRLLYYRADENSKSQD